MIITTFANAINRLFCGVAKQTRHVDSKSDHNYRIREGKLQWYSPTKKFIDNDGDIPVLKEISLCSKDPVWVLRN
jgi:hypothetical protein